MSAHAENYQKFIKEKSDQIDAAFQKAEELAMGHHLQNACDDDGEAYPLIDMLTVPGQTIDKGKEEVRLLLDAIIIDALMAYDGINES